MALVAALSAVVLVVSVGGWAAYRYFDSSVTRVTLHLGKNRPPSKPGVQNILLLGNDSRAGTNGEYGTQAEVGGLHSDTIILAHLASDGSSLMLSFPRDTLVEVAPGIKNTPRDGKDKITNVLSNGGVSGLITTLENITGVKVDHFLSIDLAGFKKMTEAVGGVTVCVKALPDGSTRNLYDRWSQWRGHVGENTLNGDQALAFVRTRKSLPSELDRIHRQQQFLARLLQKATSAGVLANPVRMTRLIGAVGHSLQVDDQLSESELIKLGDRLRGLASGRMAFVTIPTHVPTPAEGATNDRGNVPPHGEVLVYDQAGLSSLLAPLRDEPAKDGGGTARSPEPTLAPGQVQVAKVVNGTRRRGLAANVVSDLKTTGFGGDLVANSGPSGRTTTEVRYSRGNEVAARTLAAAVPGSVLVPEAGLGRSLVLELGSTFQGVRGGTASAGTPTTSGGAGGTGGTGGAKGPAGTGGPRAAATPAGPTGADTSCTY
jgi:LCP family protein required for cell wall assembly